MRRYLIPAVLILGSAHHAAAQVAVQQQQSSTVTLSSIGMFIYPAEGQSPEQQQADEAACTQWAESQTGMVPRGGCETPRGPPPPPPPAGPPPHARCRGRGCGPRGARGRRDRRDRRRCRDRSRDRCGGRRNRWAPGQEGR